MSKIFSIVSKCDNINDVVFFEKCFNSIKHHQPNDEIVIVDSDSLLKEHYNNIRNLENVSILEIKNKNYETGAIWTVYNNFIRDTYIFMQDSMILLNNIDDYINNDVVYFSDYYGWYDPNNLEHEWASNVMKNCDYEYIENDYNYKMLQFNSMICKRSVLDKLKSKNLHTILPTNKRESQAMERVFGMALHYEGYDLNYTCIGGDKLIKEFRNRQ